MARLALFRGGALSLGKEDEEEEKSNVTWVISTFLLLIYK
jgi:hypothetical protein